MAFQTWGSRPRLFKFRPFGAVKPLYTGGGLCGSSASSALPSFPKK